MLLLLLLFFFFRWFYAIPLIPYSISVFFWKLYPSQQEDSLSLSLVVGGIETNVNSSVKAIFLVFGSQKI